MLIIPIYEKSDWKHLPLITVALILINLFVYNFVQNNSTKNYVKATHYYISAKLYQHEFPRYIKYVEVKNQAAAEVLRLKYQNNNRSRKIFKAILLDKAFNRALDAGKIISPSDSDYQAWLRKRSQYLEYYNRITTLHHGFRPAHRDVQSAFSYMFLHGSKAHLIGNMIFLLILGFALEKAVGRLLFALAYLGSGMLSAEFYALISSSTTPTIGASGAISGLMGLFTVIFGFRKINFLYWVVVYFDYVRAPAIALLPLWVGHEIYQALYNSASNINYLVHLGGLIAGAMIGLAFQLSRANINTEYLDKEQHDRQQRTSLNDAMQAMARLDYQKAASLFRSLHKQHPHERSILEHYHTALSMLPVTDTYHSISQQVLAMPVSSLREAETLLRKYKQYLKRSGQNAQLDIDLTLSIARSFARYGMLNEAEKLVNVILTHRPQHEALPEMLFVLANAFYKLNQEDKQIMYLSILTRQYAHSEEAITADAVLRDKPLERHQYH